LWHDSWQTPLPSRALALLLGLAGTWGRPGGNSLQWPRLSPQRRTPRRRNAASCCSVAIFSQACLSLPRCFTLSRPEPYRAAPLRYAGLDTARACVV
jgi:hypothetical protein